MAILIDFETFYYKGSSSRLFLLVLTLIFPLYLMSSIVEILSSVVVVYIRSCHIIRYCETYTSPGVTILLFVVDACAMCIVLSLQLYDQGTCSSLNFVDIYIYI